MLDVEAMFNLNYGMCVISSRNGDKLNGCLVNTVFQITPEPLMAAVSVNKKCLTNEYIEQSGVYAVSILAESAPMKLMGRFGFKTGRDIDKFAQTPYSEGENGCPVLKEHTTGTLEVKVDRIIPVHTHNLIIGEVTAAQTVDPELIPMTYTYYRQVKHGKTPRSAASYIKKV